MPSLDLLGPATETTIDPSLFARQAAQSLHAAQLRQAELRNYIKENTRVNVSGDIDVESDGQQRLHDRCSAQGLKAHTSTMYSDDHLRTCLRTLYETAWLEPHNDADLRHLNLKSKSSLQDKLDRIKRSHVAVVNAAKTSQSSSSTAPAGSRVNAASTATTPNTTTGDGASAAPTADPRWSQWLSDHDDNALRIARPIVHPVFLRAPGYSDLQTLTTLRPGKSSRGHPTPPPHRQSTTAAGSSSTPSSLLSSLMYTITFHPIAPSLQPSPANAITRAQTLRVLGTTTLAELKTNIIPSGNAVPDVELSDDEDATSSLLDQVQDEDDEEVEQGERGEQDLDEGEQSAALGSRKRRKLRTERELDLALMMEPTEAARRIKWGTKRRKTGSAFGIEGILYADQSREVENYARMIKKAISEIEWPAQKSVNGTAQPSIPIWSIGGGMEDVVLGALQLKVGEPYYYLHDGSAEHIWTVDEIRLVHPLDPPPGASVYPITSFLSRNRSLSRCYICDIDTATLITIDDELAGRSPALMCEKCFQLLHAVDQEWDHGDEEGQRKWRRIECVTEE